MDKCDLVDLARSPLGLLDHYSKLSKIVYTKLNAYRIVFYDDMYLYNLRVFNRKIFKIFNLVEKNIKFNKNNNILFNRSLNYPIIAYASEHSNYVIYGQVDHAYNIVSFVLYTYFIALCCYEMVFSYSKITFESREFDVLINLFLYSFESMDFFMLDAQNMVFHGLYNETYS
jgi:hypothetical protein